MFQKEGTNIATTKLFKDVTISERSSLQTKNLNSFRLKRIEIFQSEYIVTDAEFNQ